MRLLATFLSILCVNAFATPHSTVIFGDSLSDEGRIYQLTDSLHPPAPYVEGRFSNGPVWTEYAYPNRENYAYGGAKSDWDNILEDRLGDLVVNTGVFGQVEEYLAQPRIPENMAHTTFIFYVGSNDIFAIFDDCLDDNCDDFTPLSTIVNNIQISATKLMEQGAKDIQIFGLPDLSLTPSAQSLPPSNRALLHRISYHFNKKLKKMAKKNRFYYVNTNDALLTMIKNAHEYGFINVQEACLDVKNQSICDDPNTYLFWDEVHPTTRTHQIFAGMLR